MARVVYKSNGGAIGDGLRVTRVSEGGQKLEVLVDAKLERYSEVILQADEVDPPVEPEPEPEPPVDPEPEPEPEPEPPVEPEPEPGPVTDDLQAALNAATGGETITLAPGDYAGFSLSGKRFPAMVTVVAADPANPPRVVSKVSIGNSENVTFDGLVFDYTFGGEVKNHANIYVSNSSHIYFRKCELAGDEASGTGSAADDGYPWARGVQFSDCSDVGVADTKVHTFANGIQIHDVTNIEVVRTEIWGVRNDSMHATGTDGLTLDGVTIRDQRVSKASGDHADMCQFRLDHKNMTIVNSRFDVGDGDAVQALWLGGGTFENLVIENNDIVANHSHGITVGSARGLRIVNNRLRYKYAGLDEHWAEPRINLNSGSSDVVVTDNEAYQFNPSPPPSGWVFERNTVLTR